MIIGFSGVGKMGQALLEGALRSGFCSPSEIRVFDPNPAASQSVADSLEVTPVSSNRDLAKAAEVIFLCAKPQHIAESARELTLAESNRLLVSIAAGVTLDQLRDWTDGKQRVVRVMPNTPMLAGAGAACFSRGESATAEDAELVGELLGACGLVREVPEELMDAVTGLSGSGPAYAWTLIEALADGGVAEGLPRPLAQELAAQTLLGAARLLLDSGQHPGVLRDQVASPGGTTIRGLEALETGGVRAALIRAVREATRRSRELAGPGH